MTYSAEAAAEEGAKKDKDGKSTEEIRTGASVDLDNLFAFLADVSNGSKVPGTVNPNQTIEEIGNHMDQLVGDLDEEV